MIWMGFSRREVFMRLEVLVVDKFFEGSCSQKTHSFGKGL